MVTPPVDPRGKPGMLATPIPEEEFSSTERAKYIQRELRRAIVEILAAFAIFVQGIFSLHATLLNVDFFCLLGDTRASRVDAFGNCLRSDQIGMTAFQRTYAQYISQQRMGRGFVASQPHPYTPKLCVKSRHKNRAGQAVSATAPQISVLTVAKERLSVRHR